MIRGDGLTYERMLYRKWIGLTVGGLALTVLAGRWIYGALDPGVDPPAPVMPANNAFTVLERAGNLIHADHNKIAEDFNPKYDAAPSNLAALVQKHTEALRLTRQVLSTGEFRLPAMRSMRDLAPYFANFRDLGRLLVLEGREYEKKGDYTRAAESYMDVLRLSERMSHGAGLIGHLTSMAISENGLRAFWDITPKLDAATAARVAVEMRELQQKTQTMADTLTEEKYGIQGSILEIFRHPERWDKKDKTEEAEPDNQLPSLRSLSVVYIVSPKREVYANISSYMDAAIAQSRGAYQPNRPAIPEPKDILSQIFLPVFIQGVHQNLVHLANSALVADRLELYAYKKQHGAFPESLASERGSVDPFRADAGPLMYRRDASQPEGFLLYSIGPDARDNSGTAIDNPKPAATPQRWTDSDRRTTKADSSGDMVAGINYPRPKK